MTFYIKRNDTSPAIQYTLLVDGTAVDITGAAVRFHMARDRHIVVDAVATTVNAVGGVVRYDWQPDDTVSAGTYDAEFEVIYPDGSIETFPNSGYIPVEIKADLA